MKSIAILYHSNLFNFLNVNEIFQCINSIYEQTYQDFDILELNYGEDTTSLLKLFSTLFGNKKKFFEHKHYHNHVDAMNHCLKKCFDELDYDIVFNINLDDYYQPERFQIQYNKITNESYDLVTSNIKLIQTINNKIVEREIKYIKKDLNKEQESYYIKNKILIEKKNIMSLTCCAFTKIFWESINKKIDPVVPVEDFVLWTKLLKNNSKIRIHISREFLCNYRIHNNQLSSDLRGDFI
jgi:hypothetical protein